MGLSKEILRKKKYIAESSGHWHTANLAGLFYFIFFFWVAYVTCNMWRWWRANAIGRAQHHPTLRDVTRRTFGANFNNSRLLSRAAALL